jgi:hypothetical protein
MANNLEELCPALILLHKGCVVACRIDPLKPGSHAWIGVYPLWNYEHLKRKGDYRIRVFDVYDRYLVNDNDVWDGVMQNRADIYVFGDEEMIAKVKDYIDPINLTNTLDSEYPV